MRSAVGGESATSLKPAVPLRGGWRRYAMKGHRSAKDQRLPAAQAIALNIAEGNGKQTNGDRRRYFEIARGSALQCAAIQDVLHVCEALSADDNNQQKANPK